MLITTSKNFLKESSFFTLGIFIIIKKPFRVFLLKNKVRFIHPMIQVIFLIYFFKGEKRHSLSIHHSIRSYKTIFSL